MTHTKLEGLLAKPSISLNQAAEALGCGKNTIYVMAASGQVPTIDVGQRKRVPTAWIRRKLQLEATA